MKTLVISYSWTSNNDKLAINLASQLNAKHIRIKELKNRNYFTVALDLLFGRMPKIEPILEEINDEDFIIFVWPIWMWQVAFPFRGAIDQLKNSINKYAFVTINWWGDGNNSNPNLEKELEKRIGKKPLTIIQFHIADFLQLNHKPTPKEIWDYKITDENMEWFVNKTINILDQFIEK